MTSLLTNISKELMFFFSTWNLIYHQEHAQSFRELF